MEPSQINRTIKQSLDLFLDGSDPAAYATPPQTPQDLIDRGLIDETGAATERGLLFSELKKRGVFDATNRISGRAAAWAMPLEQSLQPENLNAFKIRKRDGIDDTEASIGDMAEGVAGLVWDAGAGLLNGITRDLRVYASGVTDPLQNSDSTKRLKAETTVGNIAAADGMAKAGKELAGMGAIAGGWTQKLIEDVTGLGDTEAEGDNLWLARQSLARTRHENQTAKLGEAVESLGILSNTMEQAAAAKEDVPPDQYAAIRKQGEALGQFADPTILIPGAAAGKAARLGVISRLEIKADSVLSRVAAMDSRIASHAVELAEAQSAAGRAATALETASKASQELASRHAATGNLSFARAQAAADQIATMSGARLAESVAKADALTGVLGELTTARGSLATRIPEVAAKSAMRAFEIGRAVKTMPVNALAAASESTGAALIRADDWLSTMAKDYGAGAAYNLLHSRIGQAGAFFYANPILGTAAAVLSSGPALENAGKFSRIVGKELSKARGQVPFWQRVANYSEISPVHRATSRFLDMLTLGGAVPNVARSAGKGIATAYPIDMMFEFLADGGDPNADTFKRATAQALVIGGSSGMLGGMLQGTRARHRELALGDELNFRRDLVDPIQKARFEGMPQGLRRSIATYAASNPQLRFNFTDRGPSGSFDPVTNTASVNIRSSSPLKPIVAHEVMHHVVIRNQMEEGIAALLIGDGEAGGLLRSNDGKLAPDFRKFWDEYNRRMTGQGQPAIGMKEAALEYYVDAAADHVAGIAESGQLGVIAGRTDAGRAIRKFAEATIARLPIIRDLHFKMGGQVGRYGRLVDGNGLLAEGIREFPDSRRMTREMLDASAGRSQGKFSPTGGTGSKDDGGVVLRPSGPDDPLIDKMIAVFETEEVNGLTKVKRDAAGNPIPLSRAKDDARAGIGNVLAEAVRKQQAAGKRFQPGEMRVDESGRLAGYYVSDSVLTAIRDQQILNSEQMRILRNLNRMAKEGKGNRAIVINHPGTKKVRGKVRYHTSPPTLREIVPVAMVVTKDGNLTVGLMSVTQLNSNIASRAKSVTGKRLYGGDSEAMKMDIAAVMELHKRDQRTDGYFDEKYGAQRGKDHKDFIITVFGLMTKEQAKENPLFNADKITKDGVYKSYRIDRISQATQLDPSVSPPMPFSYDSVKLNLLPNGLPTLDKNGRPLAKPTPQKR